MNAITEDIPIKRNNLSPMAKYSTKHTAERTVVKSEMN